MVDYICIRAIPEGIKWQILAAKWLHHWDACSSPLPTNQSHKPVPNHQLNAWSVHRLSIHNLRKTCQWAHWSQPNKQIDSTLVSMISVSVFIYTECKAEIPGKWWQAPSLAEIPHINLLVILLMTYWIMRKVEEFLEGVKVLDCYVEIQAREGVKQIYCSW